ncbi:RidA family protein [Pseudomonas sp. PDM15]|uniref:RidA family protein n=1 Tax=Pseudomonas sp. PDM15 TaxID=2769303 RepID=UPI001783A202|nr:Rid family hydrolase [Pseudomonas sp. PDM15]MBD9427800.1 RidA family protein [Pseudomonas sp. PDM15]
MTTKNNNPAKKTVSFGVAWEGLYGYVQAIQVKDTVYLSGQLSHDREGNLIAPAALNADGKPADFSMMEAQMRQTYANIVDLLGEFGATLDDVVEETLFVIDVPAAFAAAGKVRKEFYGAEVPQVASNLIGVSGLAFPQQLIEITIRAVVE